MKLFHRRDAPPAEVVATLPRDERILSWADVSGGGVVLASPAGLWWPEPDQQRLIPWHLVNRAVWQDGRLSVTEAEVVDDLLLADRPDVSADLANPRDLPPTVRKRVETNVVRSQVHPVPGGSARFVARRIPGADGLHWWARLEGRTPDTPHTRSAISERLAALRAQWESESGAAQPW
jgi:hypothetical protein